jgi:hypothetical protein
LKLAQMFKLEKGEIRRIEAMEAMSDRARDVTNIR